MLESELGSIPDEEENTVGASSLLFASATLEWEGGLPRQQRIEVVDENSRENVPHSALSSPYLFRLPVYMSLLSQ